MVAYSIFKGLGSKWLDSRFDRQSEAYKHGLQKELESLRLKINTTLDRVTKLSHREFEVLPEAWMLISEAFWNAGALLSAFQIAPDLSRMGAKQFAAFIDDCGLHAYQKDELRALDGFARNTYYMDNIEWHRLHGALEDCRKAHIYLLQQGIFLHKDLRDKLLLFADLISHALREHESSKRHGTNISTKRDDFHANAESLMKELDEAVHERLWASGSIN